MLPFIYLRSFPIPPSFDDPGPFPTEPSTRPSKGRAPSHLLPVVSCLVTLYSDEDLIGPHLTSVSLSVHLGRIDRHTGNRSISRRLRVQEETPSLKPLLIRIHLTVRVTRRRYRKGEMEPKGRLNTKGLSTYTSNNSRPLQPLLGPNRPSTLGPTHRRSSSPRSSKRERYKSLFFPSLGR